MSAAVLLASSAFGALVSGRESVRYLPSDLVNASRCVSRCETGHLEHDANGEEIAVFNPQGGVEHQRMLELPLPSVVPFDTVSVLISVDGNFTQPGGGEVDVVVGLSDGANVWAVGSGNTYADVLRPFDATAPRRPDSGTFFDRFANSGGVGPFHARIELHSQHARARVWLQGSQEPDKWQDYTAAAGYPVPRCNTPLHLVLYRDDPPQKYAFRAVLADIQYFNGVSGEEGVSGGSEPRGGHGMVILVLVAAFLGCLCLSISAIRSRSVKRAHGFHRIPSQMDSDWANAVYDDSDIDDDAEEKSDVFTGV
eukprot:Hpha_TRINITY_DN15052_c0_g1::TRINITY_DN15052_c0_g1_i1::g.124892::m.124892